MCSGRNGKLSTTLVILCLSILLVEYYKKNPFLTYFHPSRLNRKLKNHFTTVKLHSKTQKTTKYEPGDLLKSGVFGVIRGGE